jgi:hypothetical protein
MVTVIYALHHTHPHHHDDAHDKKEKEHNKSSNATHTQINMKLPLQRVVLWLYPTTQQSKKVEN